MKIVPVTIGPVRANGVLSLHSCASTDTRKISEPSIAEFNVTIQLSTTSDPIIRMELVMSLVSVTKDGLGTTKKNKLELHVWGRLNLFLFLIPTLNP